MKAFEIISEAQAPRWRGILIDHKSAANYGIDHVVSPADHCLKKVTNIYATYVLAESVP